MEQWPKPITVDIEGAEISALEGAKRILLQKPSFYIEMHPAYLPRFDKSAMDLFDSIKLEDYLCFVNYPGKEGLSEYQLEFELLQPCAVFLVPKEKKPLHRYYTTETALQS
jgi:hypothetical protein